MFNLIIPLLSKGGACLLLFVAKPQVILIGNIYLNKTLFKYCLKAASTAISVCKSHSNSNIFTNYYEGIL